MLFVPCLFLQSIYHLPYALCDTPFVTYNNSYMFRYRRPFQVPSSITHYNKGI